MLGESCSAEEREQQLPGTTLQPPHSMHNAAHALEMKECYDARTAAQCTGGKPGSQLWAQGHAQS